MEPMLRAMAEYLCDLRYDDLPQHAVRACKQRVIDTLGCALGAFDAPPTRIAHILAERASCSEGARSIGATGRVLPELAAFANAVMARYLDATTHTLAGAGTRATRLGQRWRLPTEFTRTARH